MRNPSLFNVGIVCLPLRFKSIIFLPNETPLMAIATNLDPGSRVSRIITPAKEAEVAPDIDLILAVTETSSFNIS